MTKYSAMIFAILLSVVSPLASAQSTSTDEFDDSMQDVVVPVESVPPFVLQTAKKAVPDAFIIQVLRQVSVQDELVYYFDVSKVGKYYSILVRDDGELIEFYEAGGPPDKHAPTTH